MSVEIVKEEISKILKSIYLNNLIRVNHEMSKDYLKKLRLGELQEFEELDGLLHFFLEVATKFEGLYVWKPPSPIS